MSSCEVVGFVFQKMETESKEQCSRLLAEECRNRWEVLNLFKQKYIMEINSNKDGDIKDKNAQHNNFDIDDITCIIDFINICLIRCFTFHFSFFFINFLNFKYWILNELDIKYI